MSVSQVNSEISREEFLRNLRDSDSVSADDFATYEGESDGPSILRRLIDSQLLTQFQIEAIAGRHFERLRIGNYDVLSRLGTGGMGTVFKARHRRMKRIVAVKVLSPEVARQGSFVQRFQREVETIAQLSHPNIVMAYDADEAEIGHFLVMEFVDGRDLASEIEKAGPLSLAAAVDCIAQAAAGLGFAHAKGIVHRDIKPANLMLTNDGLVKVADLGLARLTVAAEGDSQNFSLTRAGGILGTVDYMPPEQAVDSTTIDHRADIYSLGCTLYYLLAGKPPYFAASLMGLMLQHREAKIPDLRDTRPDVPLALVAAFERMVAKRPADRPENMAEVARMMEALKSQVKQHTARPNLERTSTSANVNNSDMTIDTASGSSLIALTPLPAFESRPSSDLVLILVEPSRTQTGIMRGYLSGLGIAKVHPTKSGAEALAMVKRESAHAILSSMQLSDMTGVQLASSLMADPECSRAGFVLMSSASDASQASAVAGELRTVFLMKPFHLKQLADAIAAATGRNPEEFMPD